RTGQTQEVRDEAFFAPRLGGGATPQPPKGPQFGFGPGFPGQRGREEIVSKVSAGRSPYSMSLASFPIKLAELAAAREAGMRWINAGWTAIVWIAVIGGLVMVFGGLLWI